jgi:hypothetical protein
MLFQIPALKPGILRSEDITGILDRNFKPPFVLEKDAEIEFYQGLFLSLRLDTRTPYNELNKLKNRIVDTLGDIADMLDQQYPLRNNSRVEQEVLDGAE